MADEQTIKPPDPQTSAPGAATAATAGAPNAIPTTDPNAFSLEDLDKILEAEDPDFKKGLESIREHKFEPGAGDDKLAVKIDDDPDAEPLMKDEIEMLTRREAFEFWLITTVQRFVARMKARSISMWITLQQVAVGLFKFFRQDMPERIKYYRSRGLAVWVILKKIWGEIQKMSSAQKMALLFISTASLAAIFFLSRTLTGQWLPRYQDNMPRALVGRMGTVHSFQNRNDLQEMFSAFPEVEYYVLLKKVVVNLRPSESSGANPMGTFEIYVGVDSQDTAIEVKDRERELLDLVQRTLETFTYDDSVGTVGKSRMKEVIRDRINELLNQGRAYHVYFNAFVVYSGS